MKPKFTKNALEIAGKMITIDNLVALPKSIDVNMIFTQICDGIVYIYDRGHPLANDFLTPMKIEGLKFTSVD